MGSALQRFFSPNGEIGQYLVEKGWPMQERFDAVWIVDLAFLVENAVVSKLYSHIKAFKTKLQLFQRYLSQTVPCTTHFPALGYVTIGITFVETKKYAKALISLASKFNNHFRRFCHNSKRLNIIHLFFQCGLS